MMKKLRSTGRYFNALAVLLLLMLGHVQAETVQRGEILNADAHDMPGWFKESFLDIQDDVDEATAANRHLILFFHRDECPYCERMLRESFDSEPMEGFIREHFDVIAINTKGDREIAFNEEIVLSEKELKERLKVKYTPNLFFLDHKNNAVARLNGYRSPDRLKYALDFVRTKAYQHTSLVDYLAEHVKQGRYQLRANALFEETKDLSAIDKPLVLIFEDSSCDGCDYLHDRLLKHPEVREQLARFTVVRVDAESSGKILDVSGRETTPRDLAKRLGITYRPGIALFDGGKEISKINGQIYPFHLREALRYIGSGTYKTMKQGDYLNQRIEDLLAAGEDVDYGE